MTTPKTESQTMHTPRACIVCGKMFTSATPNSTWCPECCTVTSKTNPNTEEMKMTKPEPQTTGQLIRAARLAKSRKMYAELESSGQRIAPRERPETIFQQRDLAAAAGLNQSIVSKYESDHTEPEVPTLRKLAAALDVAIADLIGE